MAIGFGFELLSSMFWILAYLIIGKYLYEISKRKFKQIRERFIMIRTTILMGVVIVILIGLATTGFIDYLSYISLGFLIFLSVQCMLISLLFVIVEKVRAKKLIKKKKKKRKKNEYWSYLGVKIDKFGC